MKKNCKGTSDTIVHLQQLGSELVNLKMTLKLREKNEVES